MIYITRMPILCRWLCYSVNYKTGLPRKLNGLNTYCKDFPIQQRLCIACSEIEDVMHFLNKWIKYEKNWLDHSSWTTSQISIYLYLDIDIDIYIYIYIYIYIHTYIHTDLTLYSYWFDCIHTDLTLCSYWFDSVFILIWLCIHTDLTLCSYWFDSVFILIWLCIHTDLTLCVCIYNDGYVVVFLVCFYSLIINTGEAHFRPGFYRGVFG